MTGGSSKTLRSSETSWIRWESIERSEQTGWGHNQVPKHLAAELKTPHTWSSGPNLTDTHMSSN